VCPGGVLGCIRSTLFCFSKCDLGVLLVLHWWEVCLLGSFVFSILWCWCILFSPFLFLLLRLSSLCGLCFPIRLPEASRQQTHPWFKLLLGKGAKGAKGTLLLLILAIIFADAIAAFKLSSQAGPCDLPLDALQVRQHRSSESPFQVSLVHPETLQHTIPISIHTLSLICESESSPSSLSSSIPRGILSCASWTVTTRLSVVSPSLFTEQPSPRADKSPQTESERASMYACAKGSGSGSHVESALLFL
jgi:hypothetical protein